MTRHLLLFDAECLPCSGVARAVRAAAVPGLSAASLHAADVRSMMRTAGIAVPDRPALVRIDEAPAQTDAAAGTDPAGTAGPRVRCWTGVAMRVRLARLLGPRRAGDMLRLLAAELDARSRRTAGAGGRDGVGRRRFLGGAAATALAGVAALAFPAAAEAAGNGASTAVPLTDDLRRRALAAPGVRQAIATFGAVDASGMRAVRGHDGAPVAVVPHRGGQAVTMTQAGANPITLTLTTAPGVLTYHLPDGLPVAEMRLDGARPQVTAPTPRPGTVVPMSKRQFAACFSVCVTVDVVSDGCINNCISCPGNPTGCLLCAACAGVHGIKCADSCRHYL